MHAPLGPFRAQATGDRHQTSQKLARGSPSLTYGIPSVSFLLPHS